MLHAVCSCSVHIKVQQVLHSGLGLLLLYNSPYATPFLQQPLCNTLFATASMQQPLCNSPQCNSPHATAPPAAASLQQPYAAAPLQQPICKSLSKEACIFRTISLPAHQENRQQQGKQHAGTLQRLDRPPVCSLTSSTICTLSMTPSVGIQQHDNNNNNNNNDVCQPRLGAWGASLSSPGRHTQVHNIHVTYCTNLMSAHPFEVCSLKLSKGDFTEACSVYVCRGVQLCTWQQMQG